MKLIKKIEFFDKKGLSFNLELNRFLSDSKEDGELLNKELQEERNKHIRKLKEDTQFPTKENED